VIAKRQKYLNQNLSVFLLAFSFLLPSQSKSQSLELGGFVGTAGYMGDLNPVNPFSLNKVAFGGHVKKHLDGYWSIKLNGMHGEIQGADAELKNDYYKSRNLSFFSPITELSLQTEFNFFNYIPSVSKRRYSPYLFAGVGVVSFNPKARSINNKVYELPELRTEGQASAYKQLVLTIPYGAGVKYNFSGKWTLGAELGYRTAYTDYLDDVSRTYQPDEIAKDAFAKEIRQTFADRSFNQHSNGTQRGDFRKHDTYLFLGFTISYTFFTYKCPVVDN
jgi:hypothetical protein